jgi:hypothetical protein
VADAYQSLKADSFPSLYQLSAGQYSTPEDLRGAVCSGDYWAAIYAAPDASNALANTLANGTVSQGSALTYIWNGARYPAIGQSEIYANIMTLFQVARSTYYSSSASGVLSSINVSSSIAVETFLNPIEASEINLKPTTQGPRVLYNTVSLVMPIIQQFFFMMALNGISSQFHVYTKLGHMANGLLRMSVSIIYTFISALCMVGYIWAFKEDWAVNGNQFVLSWMIIWFYMHINFAIIDSLTAFVPMQFLPFCILTWVILNISSSISPFELNPGFFRWGYALPAHEVYQVLVQIWSDGCQDQSYRALPILFAWWIVGIAIAIYAVHYRCQISLRAQSVTEGIELQGEELTPSASPDEILANRRRNTMESIRLERQAYGPSYPTPGFQGEA